MVAEKLDSLLSGLAYLDALSRQGVARIARRTHRIPVERGQAIVRAGDAAVGVYFVVSGRVTTLAHLPEHGRKVLQIIGPGESFGEPFMFLDDPYPFDVLAAARSLLLFVDKAALVHEIDRSPGFAQRIIVGLSRRLEKDAKDARASALSGVQRLADMLLEEAGERDREAKPILTLPASKLAIASRLDLTPEHLSRILRKLSQRGLIRVDGPRVTILNLDGLRDIIGPMHAREGASQEAVALGDRPC